MRVHFEAKDREIEALKKAILSLGGEVVSSASTSPVFLGRKGEDVFFSLFEDGRGEVFFSKRVSSDQVREVLSSLIREGIKVSSIVGWEGKTWEIAEFISSVWDYLSLERRIWMLSFLKSFVGGDEEKLSGSESAQAMIRFKEKLADFLVRRLTRKLKGARRKKNVNVLETGKTEILVSESMWLTLLEKRPAEVGKLLAGTTGTSTLVEWALALCVPREQGVEAAEARR